MSDDVWLDNACLSVRATNLLRDAGVYSPATIRSLGKRKLAQMRNAGRAVLDEVEDAIGGWDVPFGERAASAEDIVAEARAAVDAMRAERDEALARLERVKDIVARM